MVVGPVPSAHEAKLMTATASYMHTTLIPLNHKQTLLASLEIQLLLQELNPILVTSSTMCLHHTFWTVLSVADNTSNGIYVGDNVSLAIRFGAESLMRVFVDLIEYEDFVVFLSHLDWKVLNYTWVDIQKLWTFVVQTFYLFEFVYLVVDIVFYAFCAEGMLTLFAENEHLLPHKRFEADPANLFYWFYINLLRRHLLFFPSDFPDQVDLLLADFFSLFLPDRLNNFSFERIVNIKTLPFTDINKWLALLILDSLILFWYVFLTHFISHFLLSHSNSVVLSLLWSLRQDLSSLHPASPLQGDWLVAGMHLGLQLYLNGRFWYHRPFRFHTAVYFLRTLLLNDVEGAESLTIIQPSGRLNRLVPLQYRHVHIFFPATHFYLPFWEIAEVIPHIFMLFWNKVFRSRLSLLLPIGQRHSSISSIHFVTVLLSIISVGVVWFVDKAHLEN